MVRPPSHASGRIPHSPVIAIFLGLCLALFAAATTHAAVHCEFRLGFKTLRDLIGHDIVGECLENEHYNAIGDSNQQTTGGLMAWRKADNWTAFTDGYRTWINGPNGLAQRLNTERFPWEADYAPGGGIATPVPTAIPQRTPPPVPTARPQRVDPRLQATLDMVATIEIGKSLVDYTHEQGVRIAVGPISSRAGSEIWGVYTRSSNTITVNEDFVDLPVEIAAAHLVHELAHVYPPSAAWANFNAEQLCLKLEWAAEWHAATWWYEKYGREGNPSDHSHVWHLNHLARLWKEGFETLNGEPFNAYVRSRFGDICAAKRPAATPTPTPATGGFDLARVEHVFRFLNVFAQNTLAEIYEVNPKGATATQLLQAYARHTKALPTVYIIHLWAVGGHESEHALAGIDAFGREYFSDPKHYLQVADTWLTNYLANPCSVSEDARAWVIEIEERVPGTLRAYIRAAVIPQAIVQYVVPTIYEQAEEALYENPNLYRCAA